MTGKDTEFFFVFFLLPRDKDLNTHRGSSTWRTELANLRLVCVSDKINFWLSLCKAKQEFQCHPVCFFFLLLLCFQSKFFFFLGGGLIPKRRKRNELCVPHQSRILESTKSTMHAICKCLLFFFFTHKKKKTNWKAKHDCSWVCLAALSSKMLKAKWWKKKSKRKRCDSKYSRCFFFKCKATRQFVLSRYLHIYNTHRIGPSNCSTKSCCEQTVS